MVISDPALKHFCIEPFPSHAFNQMPSNTLPGAPLRPDLLRPIRHNPPSGRATAPSPNSEGFSCQPNISSSCRYREETANKESD